MNFRGQQARDDFGNFPSFTDSYRFYREASCVGAAQWQLTSGGDVAMGGADVWDGVCKGAQLGGVEESSVISITTPRVNRAVLFSRKHSNREH